MDKLVTLKKFIKADLDTFEIIAESNIRQFAFSTEVIEEQAIQRYFESVERYIGKSQKKNWEAFFSG